MTSLCPLRLAASTRCKSAASGFGYLAFAGLAHAAAAKAAGGAARAARRPHFPARAKRVIFLCMNGGPSHVDLFDYKPELNKRSGRGLAASAAGPSSSARPSSSRSTAKSGLWISEVFPELAKHADDLCVIRSMHTDLPNHSQAFVQMHTGSFQFVRPSVGAWTLYGLGSENANLPGFITLNPPSDNGGARNYGSAFLPADLPGDADRRQPDPRLLRRAARQGRGAGPAAEEHRQPATCRATSSGRSSTWSATSTAHKLARDGHHPEIEGAIESFELAFRMQDEVPEGARPAGRAGDDARSCTASARACRPTASAGSACSPAGWPRPACGSSRSPPRSAGTTTSCSRTS